MKNNQEKLAILSKFVKNNLNLSPDQSPTSFELINKMLDQLPNEIWEDETKTFCDITCGTGTFLLAIFAKCFDGLENKIPNVQDRIENILSRIYGYDIDEIQILFAKKQFSRLFKSFVGNEYTILLNKLQLFQLDSLKNEFDMKFDVLVGNPPYNPDATNVNKQSKSLACGAMIWHKFIKKAFEIVNENGHLLFVTPNNWRTGSPAKSYQELRSLMWSKNISWFIDCRKPYDYFATISPIAIDAWHIDLSKQTNEYPESLKNRGLLPSNQSMINFCAAYYSLCDNNECYQLFVKRDKGNNDLVGVKEGTEEIKYRLATTTSKSKNGIYNWRKEKPESYDFKKIIVSDTGKLGPWYDNASCGVDAGGYIIVENEEIANKLIEFLDSKFIELLIRQFSNPGQLRFPIYLLKKIPKEVVKYSWDQDNWIESAKRVFNFSNEEIEIIKKYV